MNPQAWQQDAWLQAFRDAHGGLSPEEVNYLQALQRAQGGGGGGAPTPSAGPSVPEIKPFLTPDQQLQFSQAGFQSATNLAEIDRALEDLRGKTTFQRTQNEKEAKDASSGARDAYAARGMGRSSVKDAGLYDIQAQNTLRQQFLTDEMNRAELAAQTQKQNIRSYGEDLARSRASMMAKNAGDAAAQQGPPPGSGGPSPSTAPPQSDVPGLNNAQYQQQYGAGSNYQNAWLQAFRDSHGGLSPDEFNYLQALQRAGG